MDWTIRQLAGFYRHMKHLTELDIHYHVFNSPKKKITYDKLLSQLGEDKMEIIDKHIQSLIEEGKLSSETKTSENEEEEDIIVISIAA